MTKHPFSLNMNDHLGEARLMGISCQKTVATWARAGWLRSLPGARLANGRERYVKYEWLLAFLENPAHWHIWQPEQIKDPQLRAWAEEVRTPYLTVGQAAQRLCVGVGTVWGYIRRGLLPARRWGNWLVPEDALAGFVPLCDRPRPSTWTPERRVAAAQRMRQMNFERKARKAA